mmetsp:Transcript_322/g.902  ORF Transcript_322/g.902 Transcript_322/m.902 type:complete len:453 (+) Transcript_322:1215-2573(+)
MMRTMTREASLTHHVASGQAASFARATSTASGSPRMCSGADRSMAPRMVGIMDSNIRIVADARQRMRSASSGDDHPVNARSAPAPDHPLSSAASAALNNFGANTSVKRFMDTADASCDDKYHSAIAGARSRRAASATSSEPSDASANATSSATSAAVASLGARAAMYRDIPRAHSARTSSLGSAAPRLKLSMMNAFEVYHNDDPSLATTSSVNTLRSSPCAAAADVSALKHPRENIPSKASTPTTSPTFAIAFAIARRWSSFGFLYISKNIFAARVARVASPAARAHAREIIGNNSRRALAGSFPTTALVTFKHTSIVSSSSIVVRGAPPCIDVQSSEAVTSASVSAPKRESNRVISLVAAFARFSHDEDDVFIKFNSAFILAKLSLTVACSSRKVVISRSSSSTRARARTNSLSAASLRALSLSNAAAVCSATRARSYILLSAARSPTLDA